MTRDHAPSFDRLIWAADDASFTIGSWNFRVEQLLGSEPGPAREYFRFYKMRPMVEQYATLLRRRDAPPIEHIFELGVFDGGSAAFWVEVLHPHRYVAIDYATRDHPYLDRYREESVSGDVISVHDGIDQADSGALRAVLDEEELGELDVVIDDASHKFAQTVSSFETLFPVVRSGGWYVIEDWAWCYDAGFLEANPGWRLVRPLAPVVLHLAANMSAMPHAIAGLQVFPDFVVVERGGATLDRTFRLDLDRATTRRPVLPRAWRKARTLARRIESRVAKGGAHGTRQ